MPKKHLSKKKRTVPRTRHSVVDEEGLCPTCGYFCATLLTCPRCGARVEKRISIRLIKIISVAGSLAGIILLWTAAHLKEPMLVNIEDIDEKMNGAYIRVAGKMVSYLEDTSRNSLRMKIDDGTGQISISAFNKLSQFKKIHKDRLPELGDQVEAAGSLSETQKFGIALFLPVPERFRIIKKLQLKSYHLADISPGLAGTLARISVFVSSYEKRKTKKGIILHSFILSDRTANISMVLFDSEMERIPGQARELLFTKGLELDMPVKITEYKGRLQASISDYSKIKMIRRLSSKEMDRITKAGKGYGTTGTPPVNSFDRITSADIGASYSFHAIIAEAREMGKGILLLLDDGKGRMEVVVWDSLREQIKDYGQIAIGIKISGVFQISEYKGKLQLKITRPETLHLEKKAE
ncbi:MAG: hypothetical protein PHF84_10815 [bacterium]|nr:hypothetical protein [bacterium]